MVLEVFKVLKFHNSDSNSSFLASVSTANIKNTWFWNPLCVTGGKQNSKLESYGVSRSGKHKERCWSTFSCCWKILCFPKGMAWSVPDGEWRTALPCLPQKDIWSFWCHWRNSEVNKATPERYKTMSERKKCKVKVTELCQDICHLNIKQ